MDSQQHVDLAKSLNDRASEAFCVGPLEYPPSKPNQCHANVEQYIGTHSGCWPVRGWLVEKFEGFTCFNAHSVVRLTDGSLRLISQETRALLHYLRTLRNGGAHPTHSAKPNPTSRETAVVISETANQLWNQISKTRAQIEPKTVQKNW